MTWPVPVTCPASETTRAAGTKKLDPNSRSMSSMVTADPSTGVAHNTRMLVMKMAQDVSGMRKKVMPFARIFTMVVM